MAGKKTKMFCERCQENVLVEDEEGPCPKCGCGELWEPEDEEADAYGVFDSDVSPVDTVGGI